MLTLFSGQGEKGSDGQWQIWVNDTSPGASYHGYGNMTDMSQGALGVGKPCPCQICGKCFSSPWKVKRHMKVHTSEKPYQCNICGRAFSEKQKVQRHQLIHTGEKPYKCEQCGKAFNRKESVKNHQCPYKLGTIDESLGNL